MVVRHAHAGRRSAYRGDDRDRPLSKRGVAQAKALVPVLSPYRPRRILSSPYLRCSETVRPLAESLSRSVELVDELAEGHETEAVRLVEQMIGEPAVLCVHGDGATALLEWLSSAGGAQPSRPRLPKGDGWVIGRRDSVPAIIEHIRLSERVPD